MTKTKAVQILYKIKKLSERARNPVIGLGLSHSDLLTALISLFWSPKEIKKKKKRVE